MSRILHKVRRMRAAVITMLVVAGSLSTSRAQPQQRPSAIIDVGLSGQGNLISRCEDEAGRPFADALVTLLQDQQTVATTTCRDDGWFIFRRIAPGNYQLQVRDWNRSIRVWSADAAPPSAREPIVIIARSEQHTAPVDAPAEVIIQQTDATQVAEQEPVLELEFDDGSLRRGEVPVGDSPPTVASPVVAAVPAIVATPVEESSGNTHALHTIQTAEADGAFDPFATTHPAMPLGSPPQFTDSVAEPAMMPAEAASPEVVPVVPQGNVASPATASYVELPLTEACPAPEGRYIRGSVGPTVGDVIVTSLGVAGITMGIVAIHKYDNRRIRRVVSP